MFIKNIIFKLLYKKKISDRIKGYKKKEISKIAIIYYIPKTNIEKYQNWRDGFTKSINLLEDKFSINWINLADAKPTSVQLNEFDFILGKSCWNWIVDSYLRSLADLDVPRGIMISCSKKPLKREWMYFYDVLWYETHWYKKLIGSHPNIVHAFGIDTETFYNQNKPKIYDVVSVGALTKYKRQDKILELPGQNKLVIGNMKENDSQAIIERLENHSVKVLDYMSQEKLAIILNQSKSVYIPAEVNGGGERAVLEARSCGAKVIIEKDNPKLKELLKTPIWNELYYSNQLKKGIIDIQNKLQ